jgi:glutamate--cysteine ligase
VCSSFVAGRAHSLVELAPGTLHLPFATSLRMGRLGYLSEAQDALAVSYNDLDSYAESLADALTRPYPPYEAIGIRDGDEYRQLSTTLLQIENEFYSTIRPKRVIEPGERPLHALRARGVEYVEVRAMDLDPFAPIGIAPATARFLDVFLLHCLLTDSPLDTQQEVQAIARNKQRVAQRGREPGLRLDRGGEEVELHAWAREILAQCVPIASALDTAYREQGHANAVAAAHAGVSEPDSLPSARMLREMRERYDGSYFRFVRDWSQRHRDTLDAEPLDDDTAVALARAAAESLDEQRSIEASDDMPFETWRQRYLAPQSLRVD